MDVADMFDDTDGRGYEMHEVIQDHNNKRPLLKGHANALDGVFGQNAKFRLEEYFLKVSKHENNKVLDICEREEVASIFGQKLEIPTVLAWTVKTDQVVFSRTFDQEWVQGKCVAMEFVAGIPLCCILQEIAVQTVLENVDEVFDIFAYMHWIGDDDKGLEDVMLRSGRLVLVDNGLTGPPMFPSPLRSAHPYPGQWRNDPKDIARKSCPNKSSIVEFVFKTAKVPTDHVSLPRFIERCEGLDAGGIRAVIDSVGMNPQIANTLDKRRKTLRGDYAEWIGIIRSMGW